MDENKQPARLRICLRALAVWLIIIAAEIVHGILRAIVLVPWVGEFRSSQVGVFTGSAIILVIACLSIRWIGASRRPELMLIGTMWLVLTVAFEVLFGRVVMDLPWERLLADQHARGWTNAAGTGRVVALAVDSLESAIAFTNARNGAGLSKMDVNIRPESSEDRDEIRRVNQSAFGGDTEANLVDTLRDGGFVEVSLAAEMDGKIVGHILFSPVSILTKAGTVDAVSLAPMAVVPDHQREGIGSRLVKQGLEVCRRRGHRIAIVLGHPEFYPRFGFSAEPAASLESPFGGGEAWMALELVPGSLAENEGRVEYSPPFKLFE